MDKRKPPKKKVAGFRRVEKEDSGKLVSRDAKSGSFIAVANTGRGKTVVVPLKKVAALRLAAKHSPRMVEAVKEMDFRPPNDKERAIAASLVPKAARAHAKHGTRTA